VPRSAPWIPSHCPFSSSGRLAQKPFAIAVVAVYGLMFMSQMLLSPPVSTRGGVLPLR